MFSKRHYKFIAEVLAAVKPTLLNPEGMPQWQLVCSVLSENFRSDNPSFDAVKFFRACSHTDESP